MKNYYFTFGSDENYPYGRDDYVMVEAGDFTEAVNLFRAVHPDRDNGCVNCAFWYSEEEWNGDGGTSRYYKGIEPVETISVERKAKDLGEAIDDMDSCMRDLANETGFTKDEIRKYMKRHKMEIDETVVSEAQWMIGMQLFTKVEMIGMAVNAATERMEN